MKYRLIVFDLDGTLLDSLAHIVKCVQEAATELGVSIPESQFIRRGVGLTVPDQVNRLFPDLSLNQKQAILARFTDCYFSSSSQYTLFPGVEDVLRSLKSESLFMGIATDMSRSGLDNVLANTVLGELMDISRCADDGHAKPNPQMVNDIIDFCGVTSAETVMVGDTTYDLQTANNAGIGVIAVSYGAHDSERLSELKPMKIIDNLAELKDLL